MAIQIIGSGAFADVLDLLDGTVVKAFRREEHTAYVQNWSDHNALTTELFEAEVRAYERLLGLPDLAIFTPVYYGRIDPTGIDSLDDRARNTYVPGCGICLERISGQAKKFGFLDSKLKDEILPILEEFKEKVTDGNVWDSSCFIPGSRARITLIDFAVWEHLDDCAEILDEQGVFTDQQLANLRLNHCL